MRISYVLVTQCEKMAVFDMSFHQRALTELLVKEGNSTGVIYERLYSVYGDVCMGVSSVGRWVKHFKDGNTDIADQTGCGRLRTAATERNKQKVDELIRQDRRITEWSRVWHHAVQQMMEILGYRKFYSRWVPRLFTGTEKHKTTGNCSPIHPRVQIWPPQTTTCSDPWKITWEVTITKLKRQSRKPCEAGCEELKRTSTTEESLSCNILGLQRYLNPVSGMVLQRYVYITPNKGCVSSTAVIFLELNP
jgi:hypothetical protein